MVGPGACGAIGKGVSRSDPIRTPTPMPKPAASAASPVAATSRKRRGARAGTGSGPSERVGRSTGVARTSCVVA